MKTVFNFIGLSELIEELKALNDEYIKEQTKTFEEEDLEQEELLGGWLEEYTKLKEWVDSKDIDFWNKYYVLENPFTQYFIGGRYKLDRGLLQSAIPEGVVSPSRINRTPWRRCVPVYENKIYSPAIKINTNFGEVFVYQINDYFWKIDYTTLKENISNNDLTNLISRLSKMLKANAQQYVLEEEDIKTMIEFGYKGE